MNVFNRMENNSVSRRGAERAEKGENKFRSVLSAPLRRGLNGILTLFFEVFSCRFLRAIALIRLIVCT